MANQQYDQLPDLLAEGLDWARVSVYGLLFTDAEFNPAHERASQIGSWVKREPIQNKFIDEDGNLCGQPAVFYMVMPDTEYQLVLGYDDGRHDEILLGFFDESYEGVPIKVERRGSLFVRPSAQEGEEAASYNIWLRPGA